MLQQPLSSVLKTTKRHLAKLEQMGLGTVQDLLHFFPRALESAGSASASAQISIGAKNTLEGTLQTFRKERTQRGKTLGKGVMVLDDGTSVEVLWFQMPYALKNLSLPRRLFLLGKVERNYGQLKLLNPEVHLEQNVHVGGLRPIYPESPPITAKWLREKISGLLSLTSEFKDPLPPEILQQEQLMDLPEAIKKIHFPNSSEQWLAAKRRLGFQEIFEIQLRVLRAKYYRQQHSQNPYRLEYDPEEIKADLAQLPFALTTHQKKALLDVLEDFKKDRPMHRLLQGDVGSGKTIVCFLAALQMVRAGHQVAILAPTEILAGQHFKSALKFLTKYEVFAPTPSLFCPSPNPSPWEGNAIPEEFKLLVKDLRIESTPVERFMWELLRDRRFCGLKFRRQHPLSPYVLDFYCHEKKIAIELDGEAHNAEGARERDQVRTKFLEDQGIKVIRFWNQDFLDDPEQALKEIHKHIYQASLPGGGIEGGVINSSRIELLTGSTTAKKKRIIKDRLRTGDLKLVVGTHAILTPDTVFRSLGLAVIDEQHRFGVEQRTRLAENQSHVLAMTATPIPRSLALTIYGDQDLSIIREKPAGRKDIITRIIADPKTETQCYRFIDDQMVKGRQIFWVCPLVDESDKIEAKNVHEEFVRIKEQLFPSRRVDFLHGKMKPKAKEAVMARFKNHEFDILVSTSVIEVGVDIPNATVMVIENSERFGLAQLHQFRGRIGRNEYQSYCFLMVGDKDDKQKARLQAMERSNDGFYLSEIDLKLRGAGEVYGLRQSGLPDLKCADFNDVETLQKAREWATKILEQDLELEKYPLLKKRIESEAVYF